MVHNKSSTIPPPALVKTWFDIIKFKDEDEELRKMTARKLISVFGSLEAAMQYYKDHLA